MLRDAHPVIWILALVLVVGGCNGTGGSAQSDDPEEFVVEMEARLFDLWVQRERASWVQQNFITDDSEKIAADAATEVIAATVELAAQAARFDDKPMSDETRRKLRLLKTSLAMVAPSDPAQQEELTGITTGMEGLYGKGTY